MLLTKLPTHTHVPTRVAGKLSLFSDGRDRCQITWSPRDRILVTATVWTPGDGQPVTQRRVIRGSHASASGHTGLPFWSRGFGRMETRGSWWRAEGRCGVGRNGPRLWDVHASSTSLGSKGPRPQQRCRAGPCPPCPHSSWVTQGQEPHRRPLRGLTREGGQGPCRRRGDTLRKTRGHTRAAARLATGAVVASNPRVLHVHLEGWEGHGLLSLLHAVTPRLGTRLHGLDLSRCCGCSRAPRKPLSTLCASAEEGP